MSKTVNYHHEDRQWDARFNVQTEDYLKTIIDNIKEENAKGKFRYILIGGLEKGTRPHQDDYQIQHIHVAAIFVNRASKRSILNNWGIIEGNGYYLVPRNRDLPYSGWRDHHIKEFSKIDPTKPILFEDGTLPEEGKRKRVECSDLEKKQKVDQTLIHIRELIDGNQAEKAFELYPRNYLIYGERIKAMVMQKKDFFKTNGHPHIWLHGYAGTGKTAILQYVYPKNYKKSLVNRFFDLYNPDEHTHVILEDLDHAAVEHLGVNFIKTICDEAGFPIDQKYKTPQLARTTVLVTSNFTIQDLVMDEKGVQETTAALYRRFWHIRIDTLLRLLSVKLIPAWDRKALAREGNTDTGKIFQTWDYTRELPMGLPLKKPEEYQEMIKDAYYK